MTVEAVALAAFGVLLFAIVGDRLARSPLSSPMLFILFGAVIGPLVLGAAEIDAANGAVRLVAELTLILVLFSDASRIRLLELLRFHDLPLRTLAIGMPLTIAAGTLAAIWLFPSVTLFEAALLAAVLAPTDAALSQPVMTDESVPSRVQQAINVESGLNDGLALPAVLFFIACVGAQGDIMNAPDISVSGWMLFAAGQIGFGGVVGVGVGCGAALAMRRLASRGKAAESYDGIGALATAILAYGLSDVVGGNGFIAAFVAGLAFGNTLGRPARFLYEFMETEGRILMLLTFMVVGVALLPHAIERFHPLMLVYALASLTVIRMVPIALSLIGTDVRWPTRLFLGWFGPRGIASILFALLIVEREDIQHGGLIMAATVVTVVASAFLHGVSAPGLAARYGAWAARIGDAAETKPVPEMRMRHGRRNPVRKPAETSSARSN
ncbi:cation:proton antiporter [Amorphus sp. 3PC139-8]|uniref:cation:proton antiporter n=1 Tax=Amorphus sp. 3PC139-8 TaxID=2735676 RepID=UPI00345DCBA1